MAAPALFVPRRVLQQVRQLARDADDEEIGGVLHVVDDTAVRFEQWPNLSLVPSGWFEWDMIEHPLPRPPNVLLHTHPGDKEMLVSIGDGDFMRQHHTTVAIYAPDPDVLKLFRAADDGVIHEVPAMVDYARPERLPLVRPRRRKSHPTREVKR